MPSGLPASPYFNRFTSPKSFLLWVRIGQFIISPNPNPNPSPFVSGVWGQPCPNPGSGHHHPCFSPCLPGVWPPPLDSLLLAEVKFLPSPTTHLQFSSTRGMGLGWLASRFGLPFAVGCDQTRVGIPFGHRLLSWRNPAILGLGRGRNFTKHTLQGGPTRQPGPARSMKTSRLRRQSRSSVCCIGPGLEMSAGRCTRCGHHPDVLLVFWGGLVATQSYGTFFFVWSH